MMKKFIGILLALLLFSSLPLSADIIYATSGSYSDIQTAVNSANDGDTVIIPTGTHDFGNGHVEVVDKLIHIRGTGRTTTILQKTGTATADKKMIRLFMRDVQAGYVISDMTLIDTNAPYTEYSWDTATVGIAFEYGNWDFRAYNLELEGFGYAGIQANEYIGVEEWWWKQRGVIYNCNFIDNFMPGLGYGVNVNGANDDSWDEPIVMGNAYNVFVEDCYFTGHRHHISSGYGARYVFRYNNCADNKAPAIDAHGCDPPCDTQRGTVSYEIYENYAGTPAAGTHAGFGPTGGDTGVVYNNTFEDMYWGCYLMQAGCYEAEPPCEYPETDQIRNLYIWGNTYTNCDYEVVVNAEYAHLIQEDRDYFLEEMSGYSSYTYPHPLRGGSSTTYYVDKTTGSDSDSGLTEELAWETINEVNTSSFNPDDVIKFKRGEEWREGLTVPSTGALNSPIVFGAYGSGAGPIINGSDLIVTWSDYATQTEIWAATVQTGDGTWASWTGLGVDRNFRIIIKNGSITDNANTIRIKLKGNPTVDLIIQDIAIGERATSGDLFDYATTPSNIQQGSSDSFTLNAGTSEYTDTLSFSIDSSKDYLIAINVPNPHSVAYLDGSAEQYAKLTADDETETIDVTGYASWDELVTIEAIEAVTIWEATCTTEPDQVFFDGMRGTKVASAALCNSANKWYWAANVLYVYSTTDPDTVYTNPGIEASIRDFCVDTNSQDYIVIQQLKLVKANAANVLLDGVNQTDLNYCLVLDGIDGVEIDTTGSTVHNSVIYNCTNGIDVDAAGGAKNSIIRNNTDDLEETDANINKTTNNIEDDADPDPLFIDAAIADFRLLMASPCINKGTDVGLTRDYQGRSIRHAPDIGAYEDPTNVLFLSMVPNPLTMLLLVIIIFGMYGRRKIR